MSLPNAAFLDLASLDLGDLSLAPLQQQFALRTYAQTDRAHIVERLQAMHTAIVNKVELDAATLAQLPALRQILISATGSNNVDLAYAQQHGICVQNCRAYGTASVAQHTLMLMLNLATRFTAYQRDLQAGRWQQATGFCLLEHPIEELAGQRLGILGYGELGQAVARLAEAFGMQVLIGALPGREQPGRLPLAQLLPKVDIVTLHCPLTARTENLLGAAELALLRQGALVINCGRGGLVNEAALVAALDSGHLGGAACDVLSVEPPRAGNPLLDCQHPNLIITPHNAWGSRQARQTIVNQLAENAAGFFQGAAPRALV
ncbi:2-hydroxyacid dehydrogenase [Atopomonas sediminilitoris]|uniref:2-hydroxyacid dehydrogenase n=1 Tax=Atopomonas sediminilitoris TaxID=2919919 RepID=UPI001F4DC02C|nr:2-hydroxyacid dehydrogenase [Atopomonas sediminilitoris]MCJ8169991.1 2-hydroxyacid dehydrogenase [Atopomonas sediminilitoris]